MLRLVFGLLLQVLIQNGELIMGTLCKKTLGASEGSLIHVIWIDKGPEAARAFLSQTQYTVNYWLLQNSCSIGLGDTVADDATRENIKDLIDKVRLLTSLQLSEAPLSSRDTLCFVQSPSFDGDCLHPTAAVHDVSTLR